MGQPNVLTQTGVGQTDWYPTDIHLNPFNIGFGVVVTGTATYSVEHTFDRLLLPDGQPPTGVTAFAHETINAQTDNQDGNYAFPVTGVRLNVTAGTGTVTLTTIQAGMRIA